MNYLQVDNLAKSFGDKVLFENLSFTIDKDQRVALIARNGTGKTSLLNILAKEDTADSGNVILRNDISLGYLPQTPPVNEKLTVMEEVFQSSSEVVEAIKDYEKACTTNDADLLNTASAKMDALNAWDFEVKIKQILAQLKVTNFDQKVGELSGGQKKRLALANVLINEPDILILDEPTNHLDLEMIEWLELFLKSSKSTLIMVTHDRYFLDRVCDVIYEMDNKNIYRYKGNYRYFLEKREERVQNENSEIDKARQLFKKELNWINRMPQARATKAKYRIDSFYETKEIAGRQKHNKDLQLDIQSARLGKKVIEITKLSKSFGTKVILNDFTYNFSRFEKVGIIGENGTGKTTFLNAITDKIPYDSGKVDIGPTVVFGYYSQEVDQFPPNKKIIEVIEDIAEEIDTGTGRKMTPLQYLNYFLFPKEMHYAYVNKLSGGERRKLNLMAVLMQNPNFLILDEPTNDLDIMTLNVLEEYLNQFEGCVIIVSHDRYFMDKIVDHLFIFEGEGKIKDFPSDYTLYREKLDKIIAEKKKAEKPLKESKLQIQADSTNENKTKLSYKETQEYKQLTSEIEQLEEEKEQLETALSSGTKEADEIVEKSKRLSEISELISLKEDRWLELSEYI